MEKVINGASTAHTARVNAQGNQDIATSVARLPSAAATINATVVKATPGTLYGLDCYNAAAAVRYLKLYNKTSAPVPASDTPFRTIALKPSDRTTVAFPTGLVFSAGIAYALTTLAADTDATALTLADVVGLNLDYQ